jgi:hypothetical protein
MSFDFWSKRASKLFGIPDRLQKIYHEASMKKIQVFFWVGEVRRGREDLSDEERVGRLPTAGLDEILAHRLNRDPHITARRLAASLGISPQKVITHFHEGFEMKCFHLRRVPDPLIDLQKGHRVRYA